MTLRKLLTNVAFTACCLASGAAGIDVGSAVDTAVDAAVTVSRALVGGRAIDLDRLRSWADRFPFDCACLSLPSTPVAATGANH
jgi:hypothetical protein